MKINPFLKCEFKMSGQSSRNSENYDFDDIADGVGFQVFVDYILTNENDYVDANFVEFNISHDKSGEDTRWYSYLNNGTILPNKNNSKIAKKGHSLYVSGARKSFGKGYPVINVNDLKNEFNLYVYKVSKNSLQYYPRNAFLVDFYEIHGNFYLLDISGEGGIIDNNLRSGFFQAYNVNFYNQKISNGPDRGQDIPNIIPIDNWDMPSFKLPSDSKVYIMTSMGAPVELPLIKEMLSWLDPTLGCIIFYSNSPDIYYTAIGYAIAEKGMKYEKLDISDLNQPFDEITLFQTCYVLYYTDEGLSKIKK